MPFLAPAIPIVAGALGSAASGGGSGDADDLAQQKIWDDEAAAKRDKDFQWGGQAGGAQADVNRYQQLASNEESQKWMPTDYGQGNRYSQMGDQARGSQQDALGMMQGAAMGNAPSQAQIMMRQGNDQAVAAQMGMAAGARGPAAMAMAQQQAMGNQSAMTTNNLNNMGALRAQEMAQARGAYMGGASGMRGQDMQGQGMMDARSQYMSDMELRRRQLMQQGGLAYEQMGMGVNQAQLGARMANSGANDSNWKAQMGADAASRDAAADNVKFGVKSAIDAAKSAGAAGA